MSFRALCDREITIVPRVVTGVDARNNEIVEDGESVEGVKAGRDLLDASERITGEDEQSRVFVYLIEPVAAALALTGRDEFIDGDNRYKIRGDPSLITNRRRHRPHHIEAVAYLIDG